MKTDPHVIAVLKAANAISILAAAGEAQAKAPEWILYMPAGLNTICCSVNGKPKEIDVLVNEETAKVLQRDLMARRASAVVPTIDFDHEGKRASGIPEEFKWVPRGVAMKAGWTRAGDEAVCNKEYNYFSPQFAYDQASKRVLGLLENGPIGGLVNDPAFRALGAVMASRADYPQTQPEPEQQTQTNDPMKDLVKCLQEAGLLTEAECSASNGPALLKERLDALKKAVPEGDAATCAALRTELQTLKAANAKSAVEAAVKAGRLPAADKSAQEFWEKLIARDGKPAADALAAISASHQPPADENLPGSTQTKSQEVTAEDQRSAAVKAKAQEITTNSKGKIGWAQAWNMAEAQVPSAVV